MADKENVAINVNKATIPELKDFLRDKGVPVTGNKSVLVKRVQGVLDLGFESVKSAEKRAAVDSQVRNSERFRTPLGEILLQPETLKSNWTTNIKCFPPFTNSELYNYLVLNKDRTCDGFSNNAARQLKAKVFYEDKHVHGVEYNSINEEVSHGYIRCRVIPSFPKQKKKEDYRVWVCLSKVTGHVHSACCTCVAGEGESCNHIAGLLYALVDIHHTKKEGLDASTSNKNKWNQPRKRHLTPQKSQDLVFKKHKFSEDVTESEPAKRQLFQDKKVLLKSTCKPVDIDIFAKKLEKVNPHSAWLYTRDQKTLTPAQDYRIIDVEFMFSDMCDLSSAQVRDSLATEFTKISVTANQCNTIESKTRGQAKNDVWKNVRSQLLTASNFGLIGKRQDSTGPENALKSVLNYYNVSTKAMDWGKKHEPAGRRKYMNIMRQKNKNLAVKECGLIMNEKYPYLGASPDGLIDCDGDHGVLEVKCPYSCRFLSPEEACKNSKFFCHIVDGKVTLKTTHSYYYQVQGQMAITGRMYCDFFVWTLKGYSVERILYDDGFWQNLLPKLKSFYVNCILPELFSERVKRGKLLAA